MKSKKVLLIGISLVILAVGGWIWRSKLSGSTDAPQVRESEVKRGDIRITIRATGTVQPENRLEIKPPIAGRVEQVLIQEGQKVRKSQILAWMSSTERAAVLDAARAKGSEEVARWEELYRATPIISPINGTVILRQVEPGQTFSSADAIMVLSDRLTVKAQVDETDLAQVKAGLATRVSLDAYPRQVIPSKVGRIAYEAKTVNNVTMYEVDVIPQVTPDYMRSGMTATVNFDVETRENVLLVPNDALKFDGDKVSTLVKKGEKQVSVSLKLGLSDGKVTEVLEGLSENEIVVAPTLGDAKAAANSNPFMPQGPRGNRGSGGRGASGSGSRGGSGGGGR